MSGATVDIVIVSYNSLAHLRPCLTALRDTPPAGLGRVIVVDNASRDGTVTAVAEEFPDVDLVALPTNTGFSVATNRGIARGDATYVLALNPDTVVSGDTIDALVAVLDAHPDLGIAGPKLVRGDGTLDHAARRSFPTVASSLGHFLGIGRMRGAPAALAAYRAPDVEGGRVDAVNGAFMLIRRAALDEVGAFDEGYWMYMEDLDLCYRFAQAGRGTWYEPSVSAFHVKHGSAGDVRSPRLEVAFHRSMARFYRTHYAPRRPAAVNAVVYAGIAAKLGVWLASAPLRAMLSTRRGR